MPRAMLKVVERNNWYSTGEDLGLVVDPADPYGQSRLDSERRASRGARWHLISKLTSAIQGGVEVLTPRQAACAACSESSHLPVSAYLRRFAKYRHNAPMQLLE